VAQARVDEQPTLPSGDAATIVGHDDKVIVPWSDGASTAVVPRHDDKVIVPWSDGASTAVVPRHDDKVIVPAPVDVPAPVEAVRSPSTFDWGDAFVGAGSALALMLLAGGVALGTRRRARPAAA
jgi:hypothetical protein